jgi:hypothetical protein
MNEGVDLHPDFVTFYEGINDAAWVRPSDTSTEKTKQAIKRVPLANAVFRGLRYRFLSIAFLGMMISKERTQYLTAEDLQLLRQGKVETFIGNLQRIYTACQQKHIQLVIANQQATSREGRTQDREAIHGVTYQSEQTMVHQKLSTTGRIVAVEGCFLIHGELMAAERQWTLAKNIPYADVIGAMNSDRQDLVTWGAFERSGKPDCRVRSR